MLIKLINIPPGLLELEPKTLKQWVLIIFFSKSKYHISFRKSLLNTVNTEINWEGSNIVRESYESEFENSLKNFS